MRYLIAILVPGLLWAQTLEFELQPEAFPVEVAGWQPFCPWAGGLDHTTPDLCDLDGDGDLDYFCGDQRGYISYFQNIGTSSQPQFLFESSTYDSLISWNSVNGHGYTDISLVDIDADGDRDAFLGSSYLVFYRNLGSSTMPTFAINSDTVFDINGQYIIATHTAMVDIDADGDYDLFAGHYNGYLKYYENVGTPDSCAFQLMNSNWFNTYVSSGFNDPCFGDLDADGDLDLLIGTGDGTLYYYRNDGTAQNANMILVSNNYLNLDVGDYASPELADIDGDEDLDLFVGRSPDPSGSSISPGDVYFIINNGTPQVPDFSLATGNYLTFDAGKYCMPRLVDIDADGDPDLLDKAGYGLALYRNQGTLQNPNFVFETTGFGGVTINTIQPWFCDIDADGDYDLLAGEAAIPGPPGLNLFINNGTPQMPQYQLYSSDLVPGVFNIGSAVITPSTADIDADGDQDLFVSDDNGWFYFFQNTGTPQHFQFQFITSTWQNIQDPTIGGHRCSYFYDIDQDQDLDLFIADRAYIWFPWDENLMFYRNIGTPQNAQMVLENEDLFPELMIWQAAPFLIDMDQDGDGDMFVGDIWGGIRYFKNVMGDTSAVGPPPVQRHPRAGLQISLGPNPANPNTVISFNLPFAQQIDLAVYNLLGARVTTLASGLKLPGSYVIPWDASGNASGVYIVRLKTPQQSLSEKLTIIK